MFLSQFTFLVSNYLHLSRTVFLEPFLQFFPSVFRRFFVMLWTVIGEKAVVGVRVNYYL